MTDQAGTQHSYLYDQLGRATNDTITQFGENVDRFIQSIERQYEVRGLLEKIASLAGDESTMNEVRFSYNAYSRLVSELQEHEGPIRVGKTAEIRYKYTDGTDEMIRRTGILYPDGETEINIDYEGLVSSSLNRPSRLSEKANAICSYQFLGLGTTVGVVYNAASGLELTYYSGGGGEAGDQYTGLDRFGRLIETFWRNTTTTEVRSRYDRDRGGSILWRRDEVAGNFPAPQLAEDHQYTYDGARQVTEHRRGTFARNGSVQNTTVQVEHWEYDETGNWVTYSNSESGNIQDRTANHANEITKITSPSGILQPAYDPAGNLLTLPIAPGSSQDQYALFWDAWNRLVRVQEGDAVRAVYSYDGLNRRTKMSSQNQTRQFYYNDHWRVIEEWIEDDEARRVEQFTWGIRDRWDLLRRKLVSEGGGDAMVSFVLRDGLDPVAIAEASGAVVERYRYDAFGDATCLSPEYAVRAVSSFGWNFLFHCEFMDASVSLYNYGYRYYCPQLGVWTSRDPIGQHGDYNLMRFVGNRAPNRLDYLGLWSPDFRGKWTDAQRDYFLARLQEVIARTAQMIERIKELIKSAKGLSDKCCFKRQVLAELRSLLFVVRDMYANMRDKTMTLPVKARDIGEDSSGVTRFGPSRFFQGNCPQSLIDLTVNTNSALNFFGDPEEADATLFHELSHISGTLDDDSHGMPWNAHVIERYVENPTTFVPTALINEAKIKTSTKGCSPKDNKWPYE